MVTPTKELVKQNGGSEIEAADQLDPENFVVPGMEHVQPGELKVPLLKLVQAQSKMDQADAHLGEWHNSVTGEFEKSPAVLVIGVAKGRVMFPAKYDAENKPLCGSDDGITPRPDYVGTTIKSVVVDDDGNPAGVEPIAIPAACADCPFAKWGPNNEPPRCSDVATFAGMREDGLPVLWQVKSSGMKNVPALKTLIAANSIRKTIVLGAVQEKNDTGVYFVPVFTLGEKPSKDWQKTAMRLAKMGNLAVRNQQAITEYENRTEGAAPSDGGPEWSDESWPTEDDGGENIPF